jgi:hypothetical protein
MIGGQDEIHPKQLPITGKDPFMKNSLPSPPPPTPDAGPGEIPPAPSPADEEIRLIARAQSRLLQKLARMVVEALRSDAKQDTPALDARP